MNTSVNLLEDAEEKKKTIDQGERRGYQVFEGENVVGRVKTMSWHVLEIIREEYLGSR